MKKLIVIPFLILLTVFLVSCEPNKYFFKSNIRNNEIVSIELILYSQDNVAVVNSTDEMLDFVFENMETLEILDSAKNENFIDEFSIIEFFQGYSHLNTPNGIGVKINYQNGDFLIVTDRIEDEDENGGDAILFNSDGIFLEYFGSISWIQTFTGLIDDYFDTQVE